MNRKIATSLSFAVTALVATAGWTQTPADEKPAVVLFNGTDLTGWTTFLDAKSKVTAEQNWSVKNGAITCEGTGLGYLATKKEFNDFVLRLEWRWGEKGPAHRRYSSVFVHVTGPDKIFPKGADATLGAGAAGQFWLVDGYRLQVDAARQDPKNKRHYFAMKNDTERPIGEWNQMEVVCNKTSIQVRINGHLVNEGTGADPTRGRIILLSEGAEIHFRNINLFRLPKP